MPRLSIKHEDDYSAAQFITIAGPFNYKHNYPSDTSVEDILGELLDEFIFRLRVTLELTYDDLTNYYTPENDDEEEWIATWEEACDDLKSDCEIHSEFINSTPQGTLYWLEGKAGNLINFMEHYTDHFGPEGFADDGTEGEALSEVKEEFENYLDCLAQGTNNNFQFNHLEIDEPGEYVYKTEWLLIDYDGDEYPDDDDVTLTNLKELKQWFMDEYSYFRIKILIPHSGIDEDDIETYHDELTDEEYEILNDWTDTVNDLRSDLDLDFDWEDHLEEGSIYSMGGTPSHILSFFENFENPQIRDLPRHPLAEDIPPLKAWINKLFPTKKLGFFGEDYKTGFTDEEVYNIIQDETDENACKILFNREKDYVYTLIAYVMLLNQYRNKDHTRRYLLNSYTRCHIYIYPAFEKYVLEADEDDIRRTADELQHLNVRDYKWGVLYGSGEEQPLTLKRALNSWGEDYGRSFWKTISDQIHYLENKGLAVKPKKLGFFDK